jgi:hypothetical protein
MGSAKEQNEEKKLASLVISEYCKMPGLDPMAA